MLLRRRRYAKGNSPDLMGFYKEASPEMGVHYQGKFADLFFKNEGKIAHKWLHYFPIYDKLLGPYAGTRVRMLEIGVCFGGSLQIWRKFLGPDAVLFGIDINPGCAAVNGESGQVRIGSQADPDFLRKTVEEMGGIDVVLDDGSHIATHQRASFDTLFPLVSEGGLYIIEDMHTAYLANYEGGLKRPGTAIEFLKDKIDEMHQHYINPSLNESDTIPEIESIQFFDSIAAVRKHKQMPRAHVKAPKPFG
jgi:hypothetical protein